MICLFALHGRTLYSDRVRTKERRVDAKRTARRRGPVCCPLRTPQDDDGRGRSRATLYKHFPNKEALYRALLDRVTEEFVVEVKGRRSTVGVGLAPPLHSMLND